MACGKILKQIRLKFGVQAFNGVKVKTSKGDVGIIYGAEGGMLKVWVESRRKFEYTDPEKVEYLTFKIK